MGIRVLIVAALLAAPLARADEFDSDGVRIHYVTEGAGEAVVLIHGLGGSARSNWQAPGTMGLVAKDFRAVALDCRGHGESDRPEGVEAYGEKMSEDVARLLDHLKIEKAHVVGYSMGGIIAMNFVARHPDRVLSVVLGGMGWLRKGGALERVFERMPGGGTMPEGCASSFGALALTEEEVKGIQAPVSMIVGSRDPCRRLYVQPLEKARPDFPVTEIDGAGHITCIAKGEFREAVKEALDRENGK